MNERTVFVFSATISSKITEKLLMNYFFLIKNQCNLSIRISSFLFIQMVYILIFRKGRKTLTCTYVLLKKKNVWIKNAIIKFYYATTSICNNKYDDGKKKKMKKFSQSSKFTFFLSMLFALWWWCLSWFIFLVLFFSLFFFCPKKKKKEKEFSSENIVLYIGYNNWTRRREGGQDNP